jgi:hypothetical protein
MEQNLIDAGQQNFTLPHDVVTLPSKGVFYKNKKSSVKVGYLNASDENILVSGGQLGRENIIMTLLRNKVYEHDLKPEELVEGDIEAILLFLRNTSFGPEYSVNLIDPKTDKIFNHIEIIDEMMYKKVDSQPDSDGLFSAKLPRTGVTVKLKPLTMGDTMELDRMESQYPAGLVIPKITWRLNKMIQSIDGNSDRGVISQFVETMPILDSKFVREFIKKNNPGLELTRYAIAPSGERVTFDVTFGVEFFRPFF